jgi:HK97 family phage portal protein
MIFNFEKRQAGQKPWEGQQPLTGQAIVDFFRPDGGSKRVSEAQALALSPVYRSAFLLSGSVAAADQVILNADDSVVEGESIVSAPNPMIDTFAFWEHAMMSLLFHGNFYAIIQREGGANRAIKYLTPLDPTMVEPKVVVRNRAIVDVIYEVTPKDGPKYGIPADEMFHIKGLGTHWLVGQSVIEHGQRVFSNAMMTDAYAERFYGNGSLMSGVLRTDKRLDEKSAGALKNRWRSKIQGIENAFDIVVLDSGTEFQSITVNPQDAQFIEARRFNVEEIGRMFGIPKELLGEAGITSPLDPEQVAITFVQFTLRSWGKRIQSAVNKQLLPEGQKLNLNFNDLILADERTRSSAAVMWRKAQVLSINELRQVQGRAPIDDPDADDPMYMPESNGATDPGENQGNEEQMTPSDQNPEDESPTDMNDS